MRSAAGAARYHTGVGQAYTEGMVVKEGDKSPRIKATKQRLTALGYMNQPNPSKAEHAEFFGPHLAAAVSKFQKDHGLPVTGHLDPPTMRRISKLAPAGDPTTRGPAPASAPAGAPAGGGALTPAAKKIRNQLLAMDPSERHQLLMRVRKLLEQRRAVGGATATRGSSSGTMHSGS